MSKDRHEPSVVTKVAIVVLSPVWILILLLMVLFYFAPKYFFVHKPVLRKLQGLPAHYLNWSKIKRVTDTKTDDVLIILSVYSKGEDPILECRLRDTVTLDRLCRHYRRELPERKNYPVISSDTPFFEFRFRPKNKRGLGKRIIRPLFRHQFENLLQPVT